MKKILFALLIMVAGFSNAQQYPDNYDNGSYYNDDYPDDYYYDYPTDYYPDAYYQSYYNDYQNSIAAVNWNQYFRKYRLSRQQIAEIIYLNQRYSSFASWNSYYNVNPDRWYYERFYALQRILGPRNFIVFQRNYYHGRSPVVYFQNYRRTYYQPRYQVNRSYRNTNVSQYRVDKSNYHDPRANYGLANAGQRNNSAMQNNSSGNGDGFRKTSSDNSLSATVNRENSGRRINSGFRSGNTADQSSKRVESSERQRSNNGFRGGNSPAIRNSERAAQPEKRSESSNGFRGGNSERGTSSSSARSVENNSGAQSRGGGFR